jgi:phospholipid/cholesterol/gamma-HCH transport system permease protein
MAKPVRAVGAFFAMSLYVAVLTVRKSLACREFLLHSWSVARVSLLPTLMLAAPYLSADHRLAAD